MFNNKISPDKIEDWTCVYETSIESEAGLVHGFLENRDIPCEILSKKDSAYTVNFGDLSAIFLYVPREHAEDAQKALNEWKEGKIDESEMDTSDNDNTESPDHDS
ncbi:DUF2007 domain-containing protein [Balneolales bacterium ANBcel1]|nr:DUF2007 domain-containing protein [Balneolales bacterium ANBcel1]